MLFVYKKFYLKLKTSNEIQKESINNLKIKLASNQNWTNSYKQLVNNLLHTTKNEDLNFHLDTINKIRFKNFEFDEILKKDDFYFHSFSEIFYKNLILIYGSKLNIEAEFDLKTNHKLSQTECHGLLSMLKHLLAIYFEVFNSKSIKIIFASSETGFLICVLEKNKSSLFSKTLKFHSSKLIAIANNINCQVVFSSENDFINKISITKNFS